MGTTKKKVKKIHKAHLNEIVDNLIDAAAAILDFKTRAALGLELPADFMYFSEKEQKEILEYVKPIIQGAQQARIVEAENSKGIMQLMMQGKVTVKEAKEMLQIMKTSVEVEDKENKMKLQKSLMKGMM